MKFLALTSLLFSFSCFAQVQTINIGDFDIEYEMSGSGKHLVLLEAGMTRDLTDWDTIIPDMSKIARVIRYSRVGNGHSSQTDQQFSAEQYASHTKSLLDRLKINEPVIHISHSYGGMLARAFAGQYPNSVEALLFIDPSTEHDLDIVKNIDLSRAIKETQWMKNRGLKEGMANEYLDYWAKRPMPNYDRIGDKPLTIIASIKKFENPIVLQITDLGREKMAEALKAWAETFPQGKAIFTEKSNHYIQKEEPELVLKELAELIGKLN
ncbi:alpha/beta fold hydrolase [Thalassotalea piscium]